MQFIASLFLFYYLTDDLILHDNKLVGDISEVCDELNIRVTADCLPINGTTVTDVDCSCCFLCCDGVQCCEKPQNGDTRCYLMSQLALFYR